MRHLAKNGCEVAREGSRHTIFKNIASGATSQVPRHDVIKKPVALSICKALEVPAPKSF